jgi:hypothetical protein
MLGLEDRLHLGLLRIGQIQQRRKIAHVLRFAGGRRRWGGSLGGRHACAQQCER